MKLSPLAEVLDDFRAGKMVIIVDDVSRENEGDLTIATERLTPEALSFMLTHARGLVCVSISREVAARLQLPLQVSNNNSPFETPFSVSVDHREAGRNGITGAARVKTMIALIDPDTKPEDFLTPGNVFPLIANPAGVIGRRGQTEGSYDLARMAGFEPSGVICEILNPDGSMARGAQLNDFAKEHGLKITSVEEILRHRVEHEILVRQVAEAEHETAHGKFHTYVFQDDVDGKEHLALVYGSPEQAERGALVRLHSECLTGDVFGSERCDCRQQLDLALQLVQREGAGIILYLRQEGRGIGLANKLKAYALQDRGHDTVEANIKLGFKADDRDFVVAGKILNCLGIKRIRLLTNNPEKLKSLKALGLEVLERVPAWVEAGPKAMAYIATKREKLGHLN